MSIVYAVPSTPTTIAETNLWLDTPMTWLGADGTLWNLTGGSQGVALKKGVRGLLMPPHTRYSSTSPAVAGSRHKGSRFEDREVSWPIKVYTPHGSRAWMELNRKFWRSFDPDIEGTWTVHHPDGATRSLRCRFEGVEDVLDRNPLKLGWQTYQIRLLADSVFWTGDPVTQSFEAPKTKPYYNAGPDTAVTLQATANTVTLTAHGFLAGQRVQFRALTGTTGIVIDKVYWVVNPTANTFQLAATLGGTAIDLTGVDGTGTMFTIADYLEYLSSGANLDEATFTNEGDEPAYPIWQAIGPLDNVIVGVEGETLTIPFNIPAGKAAEIDTHPVTGQRLWYGDWDAGQKAVINRVNRTTELSGDQRFAPIPAGESRKLSLAWSNTGVLLATITPLYRSGL